jgi:hypothetical protein
MNAEVSLLAAVVAGRAAPKAGLSQKRVQQIHQPLVP